MVLGEQIEIDKRILEEMKDPFIHLLRNCVDRRDREGDAQSDDTDRESDRDSASPSATNGDRGDDLSGEVRCRRIPSPRRELAQCLFEVRHSAPSERPSGGARDRARGAT